MAGVFEARSFDGLHHLFEVLGPSHLPRELLQTLALNLVDSCRAHRLKLRGSVVEVLHLDFVIALAVREARVRVDVKDLHKDLADGAELGVLADDFIGQGLLDRLLEHDTNGGLRSVEHAHDELLHDVVLDLFGRNDLLQGPQGDEDEVDLLIVLHATPNTDLPIPLFISQISSEGPLVESLGEIIGVALSWLACRGLLRMSVDLVLLDVGHAKSDREGEVLIGGCKDRCTLDNLVDLGVAVLLDLEVLGLLELCGDLLNGLLILLPLNLKGTDRPSSKLLVLETARLSSLLLHFSDSSIF